MAVARQLAYAAKLSRDAITIDNIYCTLASETLAPGGPRRGLVRITDVERVLQVHWNDVVVPSGDLLRCADPYFWRVLESRVRSSVEEHVRALEAALASLPGLASGQLSDEVGAAVDGACRLLVQRLGSALLSSETSSTTLAAIVEKLAVDMLPAAVLDAKRSAQEDLRGVRALSVLAATDQDTLEEKIQELDVTLASLAQRPPVPLVRQFADRGFSFEELRAAFPANSQGIVSSAVPPTSIGVRASIVACWLQNYGPQVQEACVAATAALQRAANQPVHLTSWSDVELRAPSDGSEQISWPVVAHLAPQGGASVARDRVLAIARQEGSALRVARLLSTVLQEVHAGLVPVGVVHQSVISPILARVRAEREVELGACISRELKPVGERAGVAWPSGPGGAGTNATNATDATAATGTPAFAQSEVAAPQPPLAAKPPAVLALATVGMPASLLRDHAILNALFRCLLDRRGGGPVVHVALNDVVAMTRSLSGVLAAQTEASLVQSSRWVCTKVIERAVVGMQLSGHPGELRYQTGRAHDTGGKVGGVVADAAGAQRLIEFVQHCMTQMQENGVAFAAKWHTSRSARSRAGCAIGKRVRGPLSAGPCP